MIGTSLGPYKIIEQLGAGGMGEVYRARDTNLGRDVAAKVLPHQLAQEPALLARFKREARLLAALSHPNIATIHHIEQSAGIPVLIMELVDGETLDTRLARGALGVDEVLRVGIEIARGLEAAHEKGIIHRDLKPANVMITSGGGVKVLDFGIAKRLPGSRPHTGAMENGFETDELTTRGTLLGTAAYMSPEQVRGKEVDERSDVWSLGCVLYKALSGQSAFGRETLADTLVAVLEYEPNWDAIPEPAPEALQQTIRAMLAKQPDERPETVHEARVRFEGLVVELDTGAPTARAPELDAASRASRLENVRAALERALMTSSDLDVGLVQANTVGRGEELARMGEEFALVVSGDCRMVCIAGEAGMGKTTLAQEFLRQTLDSKVAIVAIGRSSERLEGTEGYLPVLEALESLEQRFGDPLTELMKLTAPTWYAEVNHAAHHGVSDGSGQLDATAKSPERMKRELTAFVEELTKVAPLILFFEDLHWADVSTIDLLAHVGSRCQGRPLLLMGTYRPDELLLSENRFLHIRRDMTSRGACTEVGLSFLSTESIRRYLDIEFPENRFEEQLAPLIHSKTEGNPLFVVNLVGHLQERGIISRHNGGWELAQPVSEIGDEVPASLRSMISRKIDLLSDDDRMLLAIASVQGGAFDSTVIARVLERDAADVEDRLRELEDAYALVCAIGEREFPDGTFTTQYQFIHILYQNALYESLSPARRASSSLSIAEILANLHEPDDLTIASELAFLSVAGRDFAGAADYFIKAALHAIEVTANKEAVTLFERAIANADRLPQEQRVPRVIAARLQLAQLLLAQGSPDEAIINFEDAEREATAFGDQKQAVNAICGIGMCYFNKRRLDGVLEHGIRAQELARAIGSGVATASAEVVVATHHMGVGDVASSREYFDRAVPVLQKKGSSGPAIHGASFRGLVYGWALEYDEATRGIEWASQEARKRGMILPSLINDFILMMVCGNRGNMQKALDIGRDAARECELHKVDFMAPRFPTCLGWIYRELQDFEAALDANGAAVDQSEESGDTHTLAQAHINLAQTYQEAGDLGRAFEHLEVADPLIKKDDWVTWRFRIRWHDAMAHCWIAKGDLQDATEQASASLRAAEESNSRKYIASAHKLLGQIATLEDRVEDAQQHFGDAIALLSRYECPTVEWRVLRAARELANRTGDPDADQLDARFKGSVQALADSISDGQARWKFLASEAVRA